MRLGRFNQYALERKRYEIDYSQWLKSGEAISTQSIPAPSGLAIDNVSQAAGVVVFYVSGGVAGSSYQATLTITTSLGQTKTDVITIGIAA